MAEKAANMNPLLALLIILAVVCTGIVLICIAAGITLHVLVEIASIGWNLVG